MNLYISSGKKRELKILSELSSKSAKSCDRSKNQIKSKSDLFVHLHTSAQYQSSVHTHSSTLQGKSNACKAFGRSSRRKY